MRIHGRTLRSAAIALTLAAAGTLAMGTGPASAKVSDGWVRGYDTWTDDWNDEGVLSQYNYSASNAVGLWQRILVAEGAKLDNGSNFVVNNIDCYFGDKTHQATMNLQKRWGLTADGKVGSGTFGRANKNLFKNFGSTARGETLYLTYKAGDGTIEHFSRNTEGKYRFLDMQNEERQAGYTYRTCRT